MPGWPGNVLDEVNDRQSPPDGAGRRPSLRAEGCTRKPARRLRGQRAGFPFPKVWRGAGLMRSRDRRIVALSRNFVCPVSDLRLDDGAHGAYAARPSLARDGR
jgi:hypothetical protein